jgi:hypothetical protein
MHAWPEHVRVSILPERVTYWPVKAELRFKPGSHSLEPSALTTRPTRIASESGNTEFTSHTWSVRISRPTNLNVSAVEL